MSTCAEEGFDRLSLTSGTADVTAHYTFKAM